MTIELNSETIAWVCVLVLVILQAYQYYKTGTLQKEVLSLWEQMSLLTMMVANKFTEIDIKASELKDKVESNEKKEDSKS